MKLTEENCKVGMVVRCLYHAPYPTSYSPDTYGEMGVVRRCSGSVCWIDWQNPALQGTGRQLNGWALSWALSCDYTFEIIDNEKSEEAQKLIAKIQDQQRRKEFAEKYL